MSTNSNNSFIIAFSDELQNSWNEINRLTSNLMPHYLAKIECLTVQLCRTLFNASVIQNRLLPADGDSELVTTLS